MELKRNYIFNLEHRICVIWMLSLLLTLSLSLLLLYGCSVCHSVSWSRSANAINHDAHNFSLSISLILPPPISLSHSLFILYLSIKHILSISLKIHIFQRQPLFFPLHSLPSHLPLENLLVVLVRCAHHLTRNNQMCDTHFFLTLSLSLSHISCNVKHFFMKCSAFSHALMRFVNTKRSKKKEKKNWAINM